jgi:hypothetical protein
MQLLSLCGNDGQAPSHRPKFMGKKVDSLEFYLREITTLDAKIDDIKGKIHDDNAGPSSCFVTFGSRSKALKEIKEMSYGAVVSAKSPVSDENTDIFWPNVGIASSGI